MSRRTTLVPTCLYPSEEEVARLIMGDRAREWPAKAIILEREGMPKVDAFMGGRYLPAVLQFFEARHGLDVTVSPGATIAGRPRPLVALAPDGPETPDAEKEAALHGRWRDRRNRRARA
ncbi:MAG: hypothetical protein R3D62_04105 [Xanthobacteraceae bacterium]